MENRPTLIGIPALSESEEMYLATIASLQEAGQAGPVPLARLAEELEVLPVSVNQMIRKLEITGLVTYLPYKGVDLTVEGVKEALRILRHRRLWEVFLVEHLHYTTHEAAPLACRLEHVFPAEAANRLDVYLGGPTENPEGLRIPTAITNPIPVQSTPLSQVRLNQCGMVAEISADPVTRKFLSLQGIHSGSKLTVLANAGAEILAETGEGRIVILSTAIAETIWLTHLEEKCKTS
ncbi:MAG: metal-dependent transcriptional regulator [Anaerolineales bacterium]|nr:metal-dependent transcriptional regulator [Anaerolineales bacterium]